MIRRGMTLLELLVVLAILAVLTTVAVTLMDSTIDQARFDATQRSLQNVHDAIQGATAQSGANVAATSGFLNDIGRLPIIINGDPLRELWDGTAFPRSYDQRPVSVSARPSTSGSSSLTSIILPDGWRGPYLRLPPGNNDLATGTPRILDGWGNPLRVIDPTSGATLIANGSKVQVIASWGADNAADTGSLATPLDLDQYAPAQPSAPPAIPLTTFVESAPLQVTIQSINPNFTQGGTSQGVALTDPFVAKGATADQYVCVVLFAPVNGTMTPFYLDSKATSNITDISKVTSGQQSPIDFTIAKPGSDESFATSPVSGWFYKVPLGSRAIQAFQYEFTSNVAVIKKRSPVTFVNVTPSSTNLNLTLILQ